MKRMIPSSKLTIKNDKLTAMEGIYDAEGNKIIADGGSLVVGNPEGSATATLSKISIQNDGEPVVYNVGGISNPVDEDITFSQHGAGQSREIRFEVGYSSYASIKGFSADGLNYVLIPHLQVGFDFRRPFQSFAPEKDNPTITKSEADEYVRKIVSGQLCEYAGSYFTGIILSYNPSATLDGVYLQLVFLEIADGLELTALGSFRYTVNAEGTLNVEDM